MDRIYKAIGLMSGTSMDGIDLSFIESDGKRVINIIGDSYYKYNDVFKKKLQKIIYHNPSPEEIQLVEKELTILHANLVNDFLEKKNIKAAEVDLIGFHGHTILHNVKDKITWQIGDCNLLAKLCKINVVGDFRKTDVANNGQGAPLVPIYHLNLLPKNSEPTATLNIGGISNIAYFENGDENTLIAFDVCFGNAPLDDLVKSRKGLEFDYNGQLARNGTVNISLAHKALENRIFLQPPPKSFDRDEFKKAIELINELNLEDALATLNYIHAKAIELNFSFMPNKPKNLYLCGGGRKNSFLVDQLKEIVDGVNIINIDDIGFNGDTIESEAFAYLGVRSLLGLPISFPKTTGIDEGKMSSGIVYKRS